MKMTEEEFLNLKEAAQYAHVSRQAPYNAIKKGTLKGILINRKWYVSRKDLDDYRGNKYNPDLKKREGELVFDMDKGHFSVQHVAKVISHALGHEYSFQHLYYLLRTGQVRGFRKGRAWVIAKEEAIQLLEIELGRQDQRMRDG